MTTTSKALSDTAERRTAQHISVGRDNRDRILAAVKSQLPVVDRPGATHDERVWHDCTTSILERLERLLL